MSDFEDSDDELAVLLLLGVVIEKRKKRKFRVHPLWKRRKEQGIINAYIFNLYFNIHFVKLNMLILSYYDNNAS